MTVPWIPLLFIVGAVSVVCYRLQNRRPRRGWSTDGGGGVDFSSSSGIGWSFGDWFSPSSTDSSGNPTDSSGSDSSSGGGGGGDSGGGSGGGD